MVGVISDVNRFFFLPLFFFFNRVFFLQKKT